MVDGSTGSMSSCLRESTPIVSTSGHKSGEGSHAAAGWDVQTVQ
jgi:hypothetical protein